MNKIVSGSEVAGFALRVKSASTETFLFEVKGPTSLKTSSSDTAAYVGVTFSDTEVSFNLQNAQKNKLLVGEFYKVQIAYINSAKETGYYSTVGIIKYTGMPQAYIADFNSTTPNIVDEMIVGTYSNETDPTERAAEYKFTIYKSDRETVLETTGWTAHIVSNNIENITYDDELNAISTLEQTDNYVLKHELDSMNSYYVRYEVKTNNGIYCKSPLYEIVATTTMDSTLQADLIAEMDYENACVVLTLLPRGRLSETIIVGTFEIGRAAAFDNFQVWTTISRFTLNGHLPEEGKIFTDFTIESGQTYRYAIRQLNSYNIYSSWIPVLKWRRRVPNNYVLNDNEWYPNSLIEASFEDAFLFDGKRQLRIRYNPKVSSFKTVLMDSKKNAIGSKYPYFFRNSVVEYKEFSISGLISYLTDQDEYFAKRTSELGMPNDWDDTTDITDDNITYERRFKLLVLDWLNEDNIKLFKAPGEGNYLVRLSGVSLSPNDSLSRMIHTFTCTADEVADCTTDNLIDEGFLTVSVENENLQTLFMTKVFTQTQNASELRQLQDDLKDIFQGYKGVYIKLEDFMPMTPFQLADRNDPTYIGQTGQYETYFSNPVNGLSLQLSDIMDNWNSGFTPMITYGIQSKGFTSFDIINKLQSQKFGYIRRDGTDITANNILEPYFDLKHQIERLYYIRFTTKEVIDLNISMEAIERYVDDANINPLGMVLDVNVMYRIPASKELINYFVNKRKINYGDIKVGELVYLYVVPATDGAGNVTYLINLDKQYSTEVVYGYKLVKTDDVGNRFYQPNILDFSHSRSYMIDDIETMPVQPIMDGTDLTNMEVREDGSIILRKGHEDPFISIGNGIIVEFGLYQKVITYDMETNVNKINADNRNRFLEKKKAYFTALDTWYGTPGQQYKDGYGYRDFKGQLTHGEPSMASYRNTFFNARSEYMTVLQAELDDRQQKAGQA